MAVTPINGRSGRVQVNGTNWNFDDCDVKFMSNLGTTTSFEDQAADGTTTENRASGNQDFQGTISGYISSDTMPSPTFYQGAVLTNLKIFLDKNVAPRYCGCSSVICESVEYHPKQSDPAQRITISVKAGGATGAGTKITITQPT